MKRPLPRVEIYLILCSTNNEPYRFVVADNGDSFSTDTSPITPFSLKQTSYIFSTYGRAKLYLNDLVTKFSSEPGFTRKFIIKKLSLS